MCLDSVRLGSKWILLDNWECNCLFISLLQIRQRSLQTPTTTWLLLETKSSEKCAKKSQKMLREQLEKALWFKQLKFLEWRLQQRLFQTKMLLNISAFKRSKCINSKLKLKLVKQRWCKWTAIVHINSHPQKSKSSRTNALMVSLQRLNSNWTKNMMM